MYKGKGRGKVSNICANATEHSYAVPGASSAQPHDLKHDFKMSPSSNQGYNSPCSDRADLVYNALEANNIASSSRQINPINVVHATNMIFGMNTQDSINPHVANVNGNNIKHLTAPSYPANKMYKGKGRGKMSNISANATEHSYAVPGASSAQPHDLKHDFKMSPCSYQEYNSPCSDMADLDYNPLEANNIPSSSRQINPNVVHATNMIFGMNIEDSINPHVANVNGNNINPLPSTTGINNIEPALNHRISTIPCPPGTKGKREKHQGPDSGELPTKRHHVLTSTCQSTPTNLEDLLYSISPTPHVSNNPFNEVATPVGGENVPPLCTEEVFKQVFDCLGPNFMREVTDEVAEGDRWHSERVNNHNAHPSVSQTLQQEHAILQNNVVQHGIANNDYQIILDDNLNIDYRLECVSDDDIQGRMTFYG